MYTKQEVINAFLELPPGEQEEVKKVVNSTKSDVEFLEKAFDAEYVPEENYSPEDTAKILHAGKEAKQGINMSPILKGDEAVAYLRQFRKA